MVTEGGDTTRASCDTEEDDGGPLEEPEDDAPEVRESRRREACNGD